MGSLALSHCSETWPLAPAATFLLCLSHVLCGFILLSKHSFHLEVICSVSCSLSEFFSYESTARRTRTATVQLSCRLTPLLNGQDTESFALHRKAEYLLAGVYKCLEVIELSYLKIELNLFA